MYILHKSSIGPHWEKTAHSLTALYAATACISKIMNISGNDIIQTSIHPAWQCNKLQLIESYRAQGNNNSLCNKYCLL